MAAPAPASSHGDLKPPVLTLVRGGGGHPPHPPLPRPSPRANRTRRVPHPVLSGHAASRHPRTKWTRRVPHPRTRGMCWRTGFRSSSTSASAGRRRRPSRGASSWRFVRIPVSALGSDCSSKHAFSPSLRPQDAGTGYPGALGCERAWRGQIEYEGAIAEAATTPAALSHAASRLTAAETGQIMEVGPRSPSCDKRRPG